MFSRDSLQTGVHKEILSRRGTEKLLVQELPCSSSSLPLALRLPRASSLCVCSPMGVWQSEAGSVVLAQIIFAMELGEIALIFMPA